jgi:quercetin dioxygenase-like cupin family protein
MEGLNPYEDNLAPHTEIKDLRNPFDEVRMVASGELLLDIAGNRLLLRPGDKILIPSNTKHAKINQGDEVCACICAQKV